MRPWAYIRIIHRSILEDIWAIPEHIGSHMDLFLRPKVVGNWPNLDFSSWNFSSSFPFSKYFDRFVPIWLVNIIINFFQGKDRYKTSSYLGSRPGSKFLRTLTWTLEPFSFSECMWVSKRSNTITWTLHSEIFTTFWANFDLFLRDFAGSAELEFPNFATRRTSRTPTCTFLTKGCTKW